MEIIELTIPQLKALYHKKQVTVKEVVKEYINRIEKYDRGENGLNSVLEINPDVLTIADQLDRLQPEQMGALHGIPILLKDNIDTGDNLHTSAGSLALADSFAITDAELVKALRAEGAVILGKANMTEYANYMTSGMPAGYSSRGGQVKSPYKAGADPSGSSTGSAVAVAANLCMASIGTDTSNSIVSPAMKNSIDGFCPSRGKISQKGVIPISFTLDISGPMTRTATDAKILYSVMSAKSPKRDTKGGIGSPGDIDTRGESGMRGGVRGDACAEEDIGARRDIGVREDLAGITIGINEEALLNMNGEEAKKAESILQELKSQTKAKLQYLRIKPIPTDDIKSIQRYEFKYSINRYLAGLPEDYPIKTLADIIEFNNRNREQALRYGQTLLLDARDNTSGDLTEEEYRLLLRDRGKQQRNIKEILKEVSFCIMFKENLILQYTGLPIIAMPHGLLNDGMPYGFLVTALSDMELLDYSIAIEPLVSIRAILPL